MIGLATTDTWGIGGPDFLGLYGALCALAALAARLGWRSVIGESRRTKDPTADIGAYKVAMLSGGPRLAITAALATLYRQGVLGDGGRRHTFQVVRELPGEADPLERAVFAAVRRRPGMTGPALGEALGTSGAITTMAADLRRVGLLADEVRASRLRLCLGVLGGLLTALGLARIYAGAQGGKPIGFLVVMVLAVILGTTALVRRKPYATAHGRDLLRRLRGSRRGAPHPTESAMAVALFGAGVLWAADPVAASALGVRRDLGSFAGSSGGGYGGGCGGGGGGGGCGGGGGGGGCGG